VDLKVVLARKTNYRIIQTNSIPAQNLEKTCLIRTTGAERKLGQYKYIDDTGKVKRFNNFEEFRYFSSKCLYGQHKHVIIKKGN
jgi:hypothetical protein